MTRRSIILGLLGAALVCGFTFFNDRVLRGTHFIGNNMPVSVYGMLLLFVLVVNPFLKRWKLAASELAVAMALTLAACCIPGSGWMRTFHSSLLMPHRINRTEAGWQREGVLEMVPEKMMPETTDEDRVVDGFAQGLGTGDEHIGIGQVPWGAWVRPWAFWIPIVAALWLGLVGLSVVLHRQWAHREHLAYPLADFASSLLPTDEGGASPLLRNRIFWFGLGPILLLHLNNYACAWFPDYLIRIPTAFNLWAMKRLLPAVAEGGGWMVFNPRIYFTVIAIAFFIPRDISLSFGIGPILWAFILGSLAMRGISLEGDFPGISGWIGLRPVTFLIYGACIGTFLMVAYTGRRQYASTLRAACGLHAPDEVAPVELWGCRAFLGMLVLLVVQLAVVAGVGLGYALLYAGMLVIYHVVVSRVVAEAGLFHLQVNIFPCVILWGLFGARFIGPETLLVLQLISVVLMIDTRETLMPFIATGLRLADLRRVPLGRVAVYCAVALVIGIAIAVPVSLYIHYDQGAAAYDAWADKMVPRMAFDNIMSVKQRLVSQGVLETAGAGTLDQISTSRPCLTALGIGLALVLVCSIARLRLRWWPLHPLMFVVWATNHMKHFAVAFLVGWAIKTVCVRYGGNRLVNQLKPLMVGLIAGEVLAAVTASLIGTFYYFSTGITPPAFAILPR